MARRNLCWKTVSGISAVIFACGILYGKVDNNSRDIVKGEQRSVRMEDSIEKIVRYILKADKDRCYYKTAGKKEEKYAEK